MTVLKQIVSMMKGNVTWFNILHTSHAHLLTGTDPNFQLWANLS